MDNNKELPQGLTYSAEDIARINAIDLSDPNSIAAINAINSTNIKPLENATIGYGQLLLDKRYGRLRWKDNEFVQYPDGVKVERVLQQEVISEYMGEPTVTEWVTVPIENK